MHHTLFHEIFVLLAFFAMMFLPCFSAYRVCVEWDLIDRAYFRLENSFISNFDSRVA